MGKLENVLRFYLLATSLKDKIRSGAVIWHISKDRLESVAEHTFGTCVLAIIIDSEYDFNFDINIDKVIKMLIIHELGEINVGELEKIGIGDLTPFDNLENKQKKEELVFESLFKGLIKYNEYTDLFQEFNQSQTMNSKFAHYCDKLELMLHMKLYEEQGYSNINSEKNKELVQQPWIQDLIANGAKTISDLFVDYHKSSFEGNEAFIEIASFIRNNIIQNNLPK